jgi:two-component system response regulator PilR (NtrC family)
MSDDFQIQLLVVDDQQSIRKLCSTIGASLGFSCTEAESAEAALAHLQTGSPDLVLADLKMENMTGLEFLEQVKKLLPRTEIAIMTGYGTIESAVQAMKLGAYDYITKPFRVEELKLVLQRMAEKIRLVEENQFLRERVNALAAAPSEVRMDPQSSDLEEMERTTIQRVFEEVKGDKALAGRKLGISRATLYRKLKRYGIQGRDSGAVHSQT